MPFSLMDKDQLYTARLPQNGYVHLLSSDTDIDFNKLTTGLLSSTEADGLVNNTNSAEQFTTNDAIATTSSDLVFYPKQIDGAFAGALGQISVEQEERAHLVFEGVPDHSLNAYQELFNGDASYDYGLVDYSASSRIQESNRSHTFGNFGAVGVSEACLPNTISFTERSHLSHDDSSFYSDGVFTPPMFAQRELAMMHQGSGGFPSFQLGMSHCSDNSELGNFTFDAQVENSALPAAPHWLATHGPSQQSISRSSCSTPVCKQRISPLPVKPMPFAIGSSALHATTSLNDLSIANGSAALSRCESIASSGHGVDRYPGGVWSASQGQAGRSQTSQPLVSGRAEMVLKRKFGSYGDKASEFKEVSSVVVFNCPALQRLVLLIADTNNSRLVKYDFDGNYLETFADNRSLRFPNAHRINPVNNDVIVCERAPNNRLVVLSEHGQRLLTMGDKQHHNPRSLAVDSKGCVVVVESKGLDKFRQNKPPCVTIYQYYDRSTLGGSAAARGYSSNGSGGRRSRQTHSSYECRVLNRWSLEGQVDFPMRVCVGMQDELIYIVDNSQGDIKLFNREGSLLRRFNWQDSRHNPVSVNFPVSVLFRSDGRLLIVDNHYHFNVTEISADGNEVLCGWQSKNKHSSVLDAALIGDNEVVMTSADFKVYIYSLLPVSGSPAAARGYGADAVGQSLSPAVSGSAAGGMFARRPHVGHSVPQLPARAATPPPFFAAPPRPPSPGLLPPYATLDQPLLPAVHSAADYEPALLSMLMAQARLGSHSRAFDHNQNGRFQIR